MQLTKAAGTDAEGTSRAGEGASSALGDESSWGRQPQRTAGNGMEESHRKFLACRRKYLIRYLGLLAKTGDVATLAAAHSFLCSPQHWPVPGMVSDIARCALYTTSLLCPRGFFLNKMTLASYYLVYSQNLLRHLLYSLFLCIQRLQVLAARWDVCSRSRCHVRCRHQYRCQP